MRSSSRLSLLLAGALLAGCASNGDERVADLCQALDAGDYERVQGELPSLNAESPDHAARVVDHGLDLVEMPPDAPASELPRMRRLLAALDVSGVHQTRVGYGRGLAAFKAGDDAAARIHFETLVYTSDALPSERAAAYVALAVLDPDPDGAPNRAHVAHYRRLAAEGASSISPELAAKLESALGAEPFEALAARRDT
jgi:hypothetical protein